MKNIKLFVPVVSTLRTRNHTVNGIEEVEKYTDISYIGDICETRIQADRANAHYIENIVSWKTNEDGTKVRDGFTSNIVDYTARISEQVIDADDYEEFKPDYEVTLEVTVTKTFTVTIDGDDAEDESDAEQVAIDRFNEGDYEDEYECAYTDNVDVEVDYVETQY